MESVQTVKAAGPQLKANQSFIVGRIDTPARTFEQGGKRVFEQRIVQKAADEYTAPGAVLLHSSYKLGAPGDDVGVQVWVTGWRDSYKDKMGETIQTARNALRVVE